jgi:hypothetical protein
MSSSISSGPKPVSAEPGRYRGVRVALVILALCAMPFVAAWFGYMVGPPPPRANYGDLIEAHPLADPVLQGLDGKPFRLSQLHGKWVLLQLDSSACAAECRKKLVYMQQLRLSQGKDAERIERVWLLTDAGTPDAALLREYEGIHVARARASEVSAEFPAARSATDHIYIADPLGNLMLRFPADPEPRGMMKDMGRLLRLSRIG